MADRLPQAAQVFATGLQPSGEMAALLKKLSPAQAAGVIRIVEAELSGVSIESLFKGPSKICSRSTYYRERGWSRQAKFQQALERARFEVRSQRLKTVVDQATDYLKLTTPAATEDLRRQIAGDEPAIETLSALVANAKTPDGQRMAAINSLAEIGTRRATDALLAALKQKGLTDEARQHIIAMLGRAAAGVNLQRRMADIAVLDRASRETANKSEPPYIPGFDFSEMDENELDQLTANLQAAIRGSAA